MMMMKIIFIINNNISSQIRPSLNQPTPRLPWATRLNPMVAPTMLCVADTGSLRNVAIISQIQEPERREGERKFGEKL